METYIYVLIALSAMTAGIVKGVSGFGSSLVTIPLLTWILGVERLPEIVVIMITFNVVLNSMLLVENKGFHPDVLKRVWLIPLFGSIFTFVGIQILFTVDEQVISYIAGGLIIVAVINKAFRLHLSLKDNAFTRIVIGSLSGIGNGIASIDGPPVVFYLTSINAKKVEFKNVLAANFLVMGIIGVIIHIIEGSYNIELLGLIAFVTAFTIIGLIIGMLVSRKLNEQVFERIVLVILIGLAISLFF